MTGDNILTSNINSQSVSLSKSSIAKGFVITKRHLPHWKSENVIYFITFDTYNKAILDMEERNTVFNHIIEGNNKYYMLFACVIMPDHVHLIIQPVKEYNLSRIMQGIKGFSARKINLYRNSRTSILACPCPKRRENRVWLHESFDRIIRNEDELIQKINYIMNNPIKKGLVERLADYPFWYLNEYL
jgi:putative transposase